MTLRPSAGVPELLIRRIAPADKDALVAGLGRLSERSVYQRFLSPKPRLTASELRYLTEVDFVDHVALVGGDFDKSKRWMRARINWRIVSRHLVSAWTVRSACCWIGA